MTSSKHGKRTEVLRDMSGTPDASLNTLRLRYVNMDRLDISLKNHAERFGQGHCHAERFAKEALNQHINIYQRRGLFPVFAMQQSPLPDNECTTARSPYSD